MKIVKVSDQTHAQLTRSVGELTAQTGKKKTYQETIELLLQTRVILPQELLRRIQEFIEKNKQWGYISEADFLKDAARIRLEYVTKHAAAAEEELPK